VAKEFFEWRNSGGGLEKDIVAAIAVALAQEQQAQPAPAQHAGHDHNPWKMAARLRALRSS